MSCCKVTTRLWFVSYVSIASGSISFAPMTQIPACFRPSVRPPHPEKRSMAKGFITYTDSNHCWFSCRSVYPVLLPNPKQLEATTERWGPAVRRERGLKYLTQRTYPPIAPCSISRHGETCP